MNATGLDVFERSAQAAHIWLNEISDHIGPDRKLAWHVLGTVLRQALPQEIRALWPAQESAGDIPEERMRQ